MQKDLENMVKHICQSVKQARSIKIIDKTNYIKIDNIETNVISYNEINNTMLLRVGNIDGSILEEIMNIITSEKTHIILINGDNPIIICETSNIVFSKYSPKVSILATIILRREKLIINPTAREIMSFYSKNTILLPNLRLKL